jgi:hypothetical protein
MVKRTSRIKGAIGALIALWLGVGIASRASADAAFEGEKTTDKLKFGGDMRLRFEDFFNKATSNGVNTNPVDRPRERFRLRFGVTGALQDITAGFRLASGTGEQASTNQTMGNGFNQKTILIDQAYLSWKAHEVLRLTGGKMQNPFWQTYASDVMWDADVNPEGVAEQFEAPAGDRMSLFVNLAQLPLNEISGSTADPWLFGNQIGTSVKIDEDTKVKIGVTYYGAKNENHQAIISTAAANSPVLQEANGRVTGGTVLAETFRLMHYTMEVQTHLLALPLSIQADYVRNMAHGSENTNYVARQNTGYQLGGIVGKAKNAKSWEAAYFYKHLEANASFSEFQDSDFGPNGGGNRKGHILWLAYAPRDYVQIKAKYFITRKLNPFISSSTPFGPITTGLPQLADTNRFQLDVVVKF